MVDTRFFAYSGPQPLGALLGEAGVDNVPEDISSLEITGADEPELAEPGDLVLAASRKYVARLFDCKARAAIVGPGLAASAPEGMAAIEVPEPHLVFADILRHLYPGLRPVEHAAEGSGPDAEDNAVNLGRNAVIGPDVVIGRGTHIGPNAYIGAGVTIGRNCRIGPNVSVECAHLGDEVIIHAGARLGTEGFGWLDHGAGNVKVPQLGRVIVQDRVEIGANTTIDRGALGDTSIGEGTKIDNLVQIGHNCRIGRNCLIAATSGLSGSTIVGDGVLMGGGVGTSGHLTIGAGSIVHGRAAVTKDWPEGSKLAGAPAQDIKDFWRELAALRRMTREKGR